MQVEEIGAAQLVGDGDRVDRLADAVQRHDRVVDVGVGRLVEVGRLDPGLGGGADGVAGEEHRSEQRLLGLQVVRRHPAALLSSNILDGLDHRCSRLRRTPGVHRSFTPPTPGRFYAPEPVELVVG